MASVGGIETGPVRGLNNQPRHEVVVPGDQDQSYSNLGKGLDRNFRVFTDKSKQPKYVAQKRGVEA